MFGFCARKAFSMPGQAVSTACALSVTKPCANSCVNKACAASMVSAEAALSARKVVGKKFAAVSMAAKAKARIRRIDHDSQVTAES
jgi:hypothetical protein